MSLDGLRAWIGLVERKLAMRTRVFLVLVAIAVGGSAAGIYLAIDAQDNSVSKADVEAVRDELAGQAGPASDSVTQLESELQALRDEVAALRASEAGGSKKAQEQPVK
jgi:TolA-binding protein